MKQTIISEYDSNKLSYRNIIDGNMSPWVMRFIKDVGKGINDFDMIRDKEKILLAVSGGKDSLALALALSLRRKWLPITYTLDAVMINWIEHPIEVSSRERLQKYFSDLDINFRIIDEPQFPTTAPENYNCYICARNRRRILFEIANRQGYRQIAMGHHLDDLVETTIMNLFFRGDFATMNPIQEFFDGDLYVIRPMIEIHESTLKRLAQTYDLPVVKPVCPYDQTNIRSSIKPIVKEICHLDRFAREHVMNAHKLDCRINRD
ncbi:MAG: adenine nucleotide alpha hydrolase [Spirochaetales bacterium]|nr:adenine nucleotide alpha hydrolase [Spirochaetales bacterium]